VQRHATLGAGLTQKVDLLRRLRGRRLAIAVGEDERAQRAEGRERLDLTSERAAAPVLKLKRTIALPTLDV
jgi:hypothetical protein